MTERWLPVVGYEGSYEVSDQGRVRGLARLVDNGRGGLYPVKGAVLRPAVHKTGYMNVSLSLCGNSKTYRLHRLVMRAFVGQVPEGMEVCHENGDALDNRLANLRYDTHSANMFDAIRQGTHFASTPATHCKNGHEFTPENTIRRVAGYRLCRICNHARECRRTRRNKAASL